jgi:signal transduction histidine kinase
VSHELRTPIAALQAVLENLVDGVSAPDPATLSTALSQTQRLGSLVSELLDLSRLDAGVVALELEDVSVAELVAETVAEAEVSARVGGREVGFVVDVRPPGATVRADRARLHQVLANLLDNAVRHGPPGGTVSVLARRVGEQMEIDVRDEGPGIAAADRERVFDRFTRGERAVGGGTGLGLAIARWAVDLHGGRIAVLDPPEPGAAGCRIRVTLVGAT